MLSAIVITALLRCIVELLVIIVDIVVLFSFIYAFG